VVDSAIAREREAATLLEILEVAGPAENGKRETRSVVTLFKFLYTRCIIMYNLINSIGYFVELIFD
jgi:hypothetical protein